MSNSKLEIIRIRVVRLSEGILLQKKGLEVGTLLSSQLNKAFLPPSRIKVYPGAIGLHMFGEVDTIICI